MKPFIVHLVPEQPTGRWHILFGQADDRWGVLWLDNWTGRQAFVLVPIQANTLIDVFALIRRQQTRLKGVLQGRDDPPETHAPAYEICVSRVVEPSAERAYS